MKKPLFDIHKHEAAINKDVFVTALADWKGAAQRAGWGAEAINAVIQEASAQIGKSPSADHNQDQFCKVLMKWSRQS